MNIEEKIAELERRIARLEQQLVNHPTWMPNIVSVKSPDQPPTGPGYTAPYIGDNPDAQKFTCQCELCHNPYSHFPPTKMI